MYLDHSATTPVRPEVLDAMWPYFAEAYANPSSVYSAASGPAAAVHEAHAMVAEVLGCKPTEVIFTGSGTEADNLAVLGAARALAGRGRHVITTQIEHEAVLNSCRQLESEGFRVTYLPVGSDGRVNPEILEAALQADTVLVSVMLANNEIGTLQPIESISRVVHRHGALLHSDAVQAAGALDIAVDTLGVDLLSLSGHKIYGPKGVGALFVRRGTALTPLIYGGGQERGRRSGTENVPGMVGMAVALLLAAQERSAESSRLIPLRDRLIDGVLAGVAGTSLTGHRTLRLPGHASFYLEGITGESALVELDLLGIACSSGSACKAGSTDPSHVLMAIGLSSSEARNGLRMSLGRATTLADVDRVVDVFPGGVDRVRGAPAVV